MNGPGTPSDSIKQSTPDQLKKHHLDRILSVLFKNKGGGLSNAELDSALGASSQWAFRGQLTQLVALGLIEYKVQLFGEPGKYMITPAGLAALLEADWTKLIPDLE